MNITEGNSLHQYNVKTTAEGNNAGTMQHMRVVIGPIDTHLISWDMEQWSSDQYYIHRKFVKAKKARVLT